MTSTPAAAIATIGVVLAATACGTTRTPATQASAALAFSRCMRAHRVAAFPDPATPGVLAKMTPQQLGVSSAQLASAQRACVHLVPSGGRPTPTQVAQYRTAMLTYARCIRTHGVPSMPDPDSRGHLDIGPGSGVDVNSSRFEAAYRACKGDLAP